MNEPHDADQTEGISSVPADSLDAGLAAGFGRLADGRGSVLSGLRSTLGPLRPKLLKQAEGESAHVVKPKSDAMPSPEETGDRYRLDGEIARGGMGAVLRGRDVDLGRDLAVKVLLEKFADRPEVARRFIEEAQIGGQLQHPGVVPVYDIGRFGDRPFFTMKLIKGQTLAALLADRPGAEADRPRLLGIAVQVAQTLAYAHAKGVIHRDLKPANIMVGAFGEVQVMDWGLAKVLAEGGVADEEKATRQYQPVDGTLIRTARSTGSTGGFGSNTEAGSLLGTPAYMPPEQANGDVALLDRRADVFGLGAILCEILTDQPPYMGRSSEEVRRKAANGDLADARVRLDACGADPELVALTKACLSPEASDRPKDAQAVADGLTAYLDGVQERVRRAELASVEERSRRRLTTVVAAALLALSTAGGLGFTYWLEQRNASAARVALALKEATLLRDQAVAHSDEPARWPPALEGLKRAEAALSDEGAPNARQQLAMLGVEVQAGAAAAERDAALMTKLVDIRSAYADDPDGTATDAAYADAFREAGYDVERLDAKEAGASIAARPGPVRQALIAALDHWTGVCNERRVPGERWTRLVAVARAADPDPDRDALRASLAINDKALRLDRLKPLAARADAATWAPASLVLLAYTLAGSGDLDDAVQVLRRASGVYPSDVWIHYTLGWYLGAETPPRWGEAIAPLAVARAVRPETGHELAHSLEHSGRPQEAEAVFRDLVGRRPNSVRHLACLGMHLRHYGLAAEAEPFLDRAIAAGREAARSRPAADIYVSLGNALRTKGEVDEAIASYQKAIELAPKLAVAHYNLGTSLFSKGQTDEAISCYRKAIELDPKEAEVHSDLGNALNRKGRSDEAIAECRKALELNPNYALSYYNLGIALERKGQLDEAIASFRKVLALKPKHAASHSCLGRTLNKKGQLDEGIAECRRAIDVDPTDANAHSGLGALLCDGKHDFDGAIACFRKAIALAPKHFAAHYNLGLALNNGTRDFDGAIVSFRTASALEPANAAAHLMLGIALENTGQLDEALTSLRRAAELGSKETRPMIAWAERSAAARDKFVDFQNGRYTPATATEHIELVRWCRIKKLHHAAAGLYAGAFAADPKMAGDVKLDNRYNAACCASLAAAGQGDDASKLDDRERARVRKQALEWLRADLEQWRSQGEAGKPGDHAAMHRALSHWRVDQDLAGVRDAAALEKLPAEERAACEAFWADVAKLLAKAATTSNQDTTR
jgi:tetratricopeptide (TPR) repeat protein